MYQKYYFNFDISKKVDFTCTGIIKNHISAVYSFTN